jgi:hypothetical protein
LAAGKVREDRRIGPGLIAAVAFGFYLALLLVVMLSQGFEALPGGYAAAMLLGAVTLGRGDGSSPTGRPSSGYSSRLTSFADSPMTWLVAPSSLRLR